MGVGLALVLLGEFFKVFGSLTELLVSLAD
jgi:hypothetical protein